MYRLLNFIVTFEINCLKKQLRLSEYKTGDTSKDKV